MNNIIWNLIKKDLKVYPEYQEQIFNVLFEYSEDYLAENGVNPSKEELKAEFERYSEAMYEIQHNL